MPVWYVAQSMDVGNSEPEDKSTSGVVATGRKRRKEAGFCGFDYYSGSVYWKKLKRQDLLHFYRKLTLSVTQGIL